MKNICAMFLLFAVSANAQNTGQFDIKAAQRFATLALACIHKEYPNKISHTLTSDADVAPPRKLTRLAFVRPRALATCAARQDFSQC